MFNQIITQKNLSIKVISLLIFLICSTLFLSAVSARRQDDTLGAKETQAEDCLDGMAGTYPCDNVNLLAHMQSNQLGGSEGNDIWGWTDPQSGKEYAIVGRRIGTSFVDISNPEFPIYLGNLAGHNNTSSQWRDIKVYQNHAFIVSQASDHGMQVFDLTELRNAGSSETFNETAHYDQFGTAHNIIINEDSGFAYVVGSIQGEDCSGGLHMINIQNPTSPTFAGCFSDNGNINDAQCVTYNGPDSAHQGKEICFAANNNSLSIVDVSDKSSPIQLSRTDYDGRQYPNQGWLTLDQTYFLLGDIEDEVDNQHNTRTYIWDVSNLDSPSVIGNHTSELPAIDHNQYIKGNYVYQANFRAGLRILDLSDIANGNLSEAAYFDIYPSNDNAAQNAAWSVYPFFESGIVIVSGIEQGLFILEPNLANPITPTPTPTHTPISPSSTPTSPPNSPTASPTPALPTATPTSRPPSEGDSYEDDDSCSNASHIQTTGSLQYHSLHDEADADWISFDATADTEVVIEARVPPSSTADLVLDLYPDCLGTLADEEDEEANRDIRIIFEPSASGRYYLKLYHKEPLVHGPDADYYLSVRVPQEATSSSAVIIVEGQKGPGDKLQNNIESVANKFHDFITSYSCSPQQITYIDGTQGGTEAQLEEAITSWAPQQVAQDGTLTIYMVDHGQPDNLYLDHTNNQDITSKELDGWLDQLENARPDLKINVIVEACWSGSFIQPMNGSISGNGRVIITSTSPYWWAYTSQNGATFSDKFINELKQGSSLNLAFLEGSWAANRVRAEQQAWLDDNGDQKYDATDGDIAAERSLACIPIVPGENYPPYLQKVELSLSEGKIRAEVVDDHQAVNKVWALLYPPSYESEPEEDELGEEPVYLQLSSDGNNKYSVDYTFDEIGAYRVVLYANDTQEQESRPKEAQIYALYLPTITR